MILNEFFNLPQVFEKDMTEAESTHTDMTVAQQVFKDNPDIDHEDDILNAAFPYVVELVGSRKRANYMFNYDEDFPGDLISAYRYLQRDQHDVGLEEGMFDRRPSPVLPLVDKIAKVARGLTPQNVETGKQIIQANAKDITRMLSPQDKAGVDVIEAAKWRDPKYKDQLYTQEPPDYNDTREYDRAMFDPKPDDYPGRKELPGGGEYDRTDPLVRGAGIGRSGIKNNILDRGKRKGLPSRDQITSLKQSIRDVHGKHTRANLPEQGVAEGLSKQFEIIYLDQSGERKRKIVSGTSKESVARQFKKQYKLEIEQVKQLQQGVAEGHADQQRKIFKKNGHPVGEVGIDRESSPGVGQWYMKYYATGDDFSGYDSMEDAVAELKHLVSQFKAEGLNLEPMGSKKQRDIQRQQGLIPTGPHRLMSELADMLHISVGQLTWLAQKIPGFPLARNRGTASQGNKGYYDLAAFKRWVVANKVREKIRDWDQQGVAEGHTDQQKGADHRDPPEADYGPEYQAMVRRVGQKAREQEKARQQPRPKAPVRESRRALLKQIIQS